MPIIYWFTGAYSRIKWLFFFFSSIILSPSHPTEKESEGVAPVIQPQCSLYFLLLYLLGIIHSLIHSSNFRMDKKKGIASKKSLSLEGLDGVCSRIANTLPHWLIDSSRLEDTFKVTQYIHPPGTANITPKPVPDPDAQAPSGIRTPQLLREAEHPESEKIIF